LPKRPGAVRSRQSAIGNRQSAIGNRQSAIGNRQSAIGNRQSAIEVSMTELRYPIGKFEHRPGTAADRAQWIEDIETLPDRLRDAVAGLSDAQLDTPYRPGGWTVRQLVHHLADSHINSYVRFRLAVTEHEPTIRPYDQESWAELPDARTGDVEVSITLLDSLHERWVRLLRSFDEGDFARKLHHPESGTLDLDYLTAMYAWHCRHHVAHVTELRKKEGW